ncbi:distal tail protein Dit, partial [Lacticaseibacillus paracasei]|uniref:distal tail protein Dit n=1 Tax=Lacticaseibacillus paracasei TaxID=1597 RepID=UPI003852B935
MANLIFGGHKIGSSSLQFSAARGVFSEVENTTQPVGAGDGEIFIRSRLKSRIIPVTYDFVALSRREFERQLAPLLYSTDVQKLIIDDRPDEFWYAKVDGKIDMDRAYFLGTGTINFLVPDGIAHSVATKTADNMPYKDLPVNLLTGTSDQETSGTIPAKGWSIPSQRRFIKVTAGQKFTYRIFITADNTIDSLVTADIFSGDTWKAQYLGNVIKAGTSGYSSVTFTIPSGVDTLNVNGAALVKLVPDSETTIYWKEEKLNAGTTVSPWSPNPADPEYYTDTITLHNGGTYLVEPVITATMHADNGLIAFINSQGGVLQFGNPEEADGVERQRSEVARYEGFDKEPVGAAYNTGQTNSHYYYIKNQKNIMEGSVKYADD